MTVGIQGPVYCTLHNHQPNAPNYEKCSAEHIVHTLTRPDQVRLSSYLLVRFNRTSAMPKPYRAIQAMFKTNRWRIFRGDEVCVLNRRLDDDLVVQLEGRRNSRSAAASMADANGQGPSTSGQQHSREPRPLVTGTVLEVIQDRRQPMIIVEGVNLVRSLSSTRVTHFANMCTMHACEAACMRRQDIDSDT